MILKNSQVPSHLSRSVSMDPESVSHGSGAETCDYELIRILVWIKKRRL